MEPGVQGILCIAGFIQCRHSVIQKMIAGSHVALLANTQIPETSSCGLGTMQENSRHITYTQEMKRHHTFAMTHQSD